MIRLASKYIFISLFLICITLIFSKDKNNSFVKYFDEGNKYFINNEYNKALDSYLKAYEIKINYDILYNISLTYYKLNQIGYSRFYAEKALFLNPMNSDVNKLLSNIYKTSNDDLSDLIFVYKFFFLINSNTLFIIFLVIYLLSIYFLFFSKRSINKKILVILCLILILFISVMLIAQEFLISNNYGYVIHNTNIYLTNSEETVVSHINDGDKVIILNSDNEFYNVKFNTNIYGWIKKDCIVNNSKKLKKLF